MHFQPTITTANLLISQSVIIKGLLKDLQERSNVVSVIINFSAQTSSMQTQEIIESKLERKRKTILGIVNLHVKIVQEVMLVIGCCQ